MHQRQAILEAIKANLSTIKSFQRVRITRQATSAAIGNVFPAITLFPASETTDTLTIHRQARPQERVLLVSVRGWVLGTVDVEKAESDMSIVSARIESAMTNQITGINDVLLLATDFEVAEDEPQIHIVTLNYRVDYFINEMSQTALP